MKREATFIVIPIIILAIVGIWFLKKIKEHNDAENMQKTTESSGINAKDEGVDADFSLAATELIDYEKLSKFGYPIIVDYGSDECIPCKRMAPVLKTLNEELQGKVFVKFVDVWKYPDAAASAPIQVIPTQVFFNANGAPFVPSDELASKILFEMYKSKDTGKHIFTVHKGEITEAEMRFILAEMRGTE